MAINNLIYHHNCCRFGVLESLRTDNCSDFDNDIIENLTKLLQIHHHCSIPYYPQSNGLVERLVYLFKNSVKQTIMDQLQGGPDSESAPYWAHLVDFLLYANRCTLHSATSVFKATLLYD